MAKFCVRMDNIELNVSSFGKVIQELVYDMKELQNEVKHLKKQNQEHEDEKKRMNEEKKRQNEVIEKLKTENVMLKKRLDNKDDEVRQQKENIEKLQHDQSGWRKVQKDSETDLRKIIKDQQQEQKEQLEKEMIKVLKKKEDVIRGVIDKKKCAIVFGLKEEHNPVRSKREKDELQNIKKLIKVFNEEEEEAIEKEIDEVGRIGKYKEGGKRPVRIKFKSQTAAGEVLQRSGKLKVTEEYKTVWIKKDMNEEERAEEKDLWNEMKEKNGQRTEEEKKKFFWKIRDGKLRKWYLQTEQ